jgi:hypothetical protein
VTRSAARKEVARRQRRWADSAGLAFDARGFLREHNRNVRVPLDAAVLEELARGSELEPGNLRPARMWSLCSSAALVANFFAPWRECPNRPLLQSLDLKGADARVSFEEPLSTGLEGDPPTADVALRLDTGALIAIESKFCEWLVRRPRNKAVFKPKYFPIDVPVWANAGLPRCQALAEDIEGGRERFKLLNAAQLLKHALGLAISAPRESELMYLYYHWPCREAGLHAAEVVRFAARVAGDLRFRAMTYQAAFDSLCAAAGVDADYLEYLRARYFA